MSLKVGSDEDRYQGSGPSSPEKKFKGPGIGTMLGRCYQIIDLGTQDSEWEGKKKTEHQILISWELPAKLMDDGRPFAVSRFYNAAGGPKSILKNDLEGWRGRPFEDDIAYKKFNIAVMIGETAILTVKLNKAGKTVVAGVAAPFEGMGVPPAFNRQVLFDLSKYLSGDPDMLQAWKMVTDGVRKIIKRSRQWQEAEQLGNLPTAEEDGGVPF